MLQPAAQGSEESGATFEASKTGFIHFERWPTEAESKPSLQFFDSEVKPRDAIEILGVILDTKLHMTAHVDKIITMATKKCLTIGRLRGIRPKQMRQLHRAVLDTTTDYAASTWYATGRLGVQQHMTCLEHIKEMASSRLRNSPIPPGSLPSLLVLRCPADFFRAPKSGRPGSSVRHGGRQQR